MHGFTHLALPPPTSIDKETFIVIWNNATSIDDVVDKLNLEKSYGSRSKAYNGVLQHASRLRGCGTRLKRLNRKR